jgi:hypothetical protein
MEVSEEEKARKKLLKLWRDYPMLMQYHVARAPFKSLGHVRGEP